MDLKVGRGCLEERPQFLQPVPTTSIHRRAVLMAAAWRTAPSHVIGTSWEDGATCTWVCACPFQNRLHVNLRFLTDEEQSFPVKGLHKLLGKQTNQPWWPARYCRFRRDTADDTYPSCSSHPALSTRAAHSSHGFHLQWQEVWPTIARWPIIAPFVIGNHQKYVL